MSSEHAISYEDLEKRRQKASAARKPSTITPVVEAESEAMQVINEIFHPTLKIPVTTGPYRPPSELSTDDFDAMRDLDLRKLAELKEVFLLFDTNCDGIISKDDLRFTFGALGSEVTEEMLEEMLKEAKEPLDVNAFIELMSHRTIELDPEDVLLEAWSKWDLYGTGKIEEKNCLDYIEIFPYLREQVVENTTLPEYIFCNQTQTAVPQQSSNITNIFNSHSYSNSKNITKYYENASSPHTISNIDPYANISSTASTTIIMNVDDLLPNEFIYSSGKIFAIRLRFTKPMIPKIDTWYLSVSAEYRFLKKEKFKNDGRLIPGTYCDYYFFANTEVAPPSTLEIWKYFHSPRFPAKYPSHIKCSYKFIGRPETRVEIIFEELHIPRKGTSCNLDKLTVFDAESTNMNAVIDVLCGMVTNSHHILSTGPDLLIEFNTSSNETSKGFRGKFKFVQNDIVNSIVTDSSIIAEDIQTAIRQENNMAFKAIDDMKISNGFKEESCKEIYSSRWNKSGVFDSSQLIPVNVRLTNINNLMPHYNTGRVECIYEFYASDNEYIQVKFIDFNIPTEHKNSTACMPNDSLQLLTQVKGKYEAVDYYCGAFLPKPIMSKGPKLMLQFIGKYPIKQEKVGYYGFKAEYKFLTNFGITTGYQLGHNCSFIYNSTVRKMGFFTSPNFPGLYPQNIACHYLFYGEFEEKVKINFIFFDVEGIDSCGYQTASDYVEFSNFISTDRKFPKYCGKRDKFEIRSDDRFFRVSFYSNDRFDRNGFRAYYEFKRMSTPPENTSLQSYTSVSSPGSSNSFVKFVILLMYGLYECTIM